MNELSEKFGPLGLLNEALAEAQTTVRAYDTKAQIVGVGYAFALGIVGATKDWLPAAGGGSVLSVLVFWLVVMAPLVLFGFVLYPSRKTAPEVDVASEKLQKILNKIHTDLTIAYSICTECVIESYTQLMVS